MNLQYKFINKYIYSCNESSWSEQNRLYFLRFDAIDFKTWLVVGIFMYELFNVIDT